MDLTPRDCADLLHRHRPLLVYDPQANYRALAAETMVENNGNRLMREGSVLVDSVGPRSDSLTLGYLARYESREGDSLSQAPRRAVAARRLQGDPHYADVVYGRPVIDGDTLWLQYWIWFYYWPARLLGTGRHEGDWKMLQIGFDLVEERPRSIAATRGSKNLRQQWDHVLKYRCRDACGKGCAHPRATIAPFSHGIRMIGVDEGRQDADPDPTRLERLPRLEEFGDWASWPGRWGNTDALGRFGRSPRGPGHTQPAWSSPSDFHEKAKERSRSTSSSREWVERRLRPKTPKISAAYCVDSAVVVDVDVGLPRLRRRQWVFVTVHLKTHGEVIRSRAVSVGRGLTRISIPLSDSGPLDAFVRASIFSRFRRRSEVVTAAVAKTTSDRILPKWPESVVRRFRHALVSELMSGGAASVAELEWRGFNVLDLALDRKEIEAAVESARLHGLIEPLGQSWHADGTVVTKDEWTPTEGGRLRSRRLSEAAPGAIKALPGALIAAVIAGVAKSFDVEGNWLFIIAGVVMALILVAAIGSFVLRRSQGALPRAVARTWDRHAVELPELNRWYSRRYRFVPYLLACVAIAGAIALVVVGSGGDAHFGTLEVTGEVGLGIVTGTILAFLVDDLHRTKALRREAIARREWRDSAPIPSS